MKRISLKVTKNGEIFIETHGFKGKSCIEATNQLLQSLGGKQCQEKKESYYEQEIEQENHIEEDWW
jgi:hypothetical protein